MDFTGFWPVANGPLVDVPWHEVPAAKRLQSQPDDSERPSEWAGPQGQAGQRAWGPVLSVY